MLQVGVKAMLRLASSSLGPASLPTRMPLLKPFERMLLVMVASAENPKLNRTIGQTRYGSGSSPWPFPLAVYASRPGPGSQSRCVPIIYMYYIYICGIK